MSDTLDRRVDDMRMDNLENIISTIQKSVSKVEKKIFNGYDTSIKSTENKVNYIDERNREEHKELKEIIRELAVSNENRNEQLSKKFDKMLWFLMTSSIAISGGIILAIVKGWIS